MEAKKYKTAFVLWLGKCEEKEKCMSVKQYMIYEMILGKVKRLKLYP